MLRLALKFPLAAGVGLAALEPSVTPHAAVQLQAAEGARMCTV